MRELGIRVDEALLRRLTDDKAARIDREVGRRNVWAVELHPNLTLASPLHAQRAGGAQLMHPVLGRPR